MTLTQQMAEAEEDRRRHDAASRLRALKQDSRASERQLGRNRRLRIAGIVTASLIVVAAAAAWAFLNFPRQPIGEPTATPTASPTPTAESFGPPPEIVLIGGDLVANPPERPFWRPDQTVLAATMLGERAGYAVYGFVTDDNEVCIHLENPEIGVGNCTTYLDFVANGAIVDRGSWDIRWWADGRVEWTGI